MAPATSRPRPWTKCLLAGSLFGVAPTAAEKVPWISYSNRNCYTSDKDGFRGARVISFETNPIVKPKLFLSMPECRARCIAEPECDGFVMQDTDGNRPSCWLRKGIKQLECSTEFSDFTLYQNPLVYTAGAESVASYPGLDCVTPPGAATPIVTLSGEAALAGLTVRACESLCRQHSACTGIMWKQVADLEQRGKDANCWMLKDIDLSKCLSDASSERYEIRTLDPSAVPRTTAAPSTSKGASSTSGTKIATTKQAALPGAPWSTQSSVNCASGKGGDGVNSYVDPIPGHHLLQWCQEKCEELPACEAVVMHDTQDGTSNNCYLRKNIDLTLCDHSASRYNIWFRPGQAVGARLGWHSFAGKNCHPGAGAAYAVDGQDVLPGHLDLVQCEVECQKTSGCEAIVWHDTTDGTRGNCYLRKHVVLSACVQNPAFNVRIRTSVLVTTTPRTTSPSASVSVTTTPRLTSPSAPSTTSPSTSSSTTIAPHPLPQGWPTVSATNCFDKFGGEALAEEGFDPVPIHQLLTGCQELCLKKKECQAIIMADVRNGNVPNCWLRKKIALNECRENPSSSVWFKPGVRKLEQDKWLSYAATNCYPGMGADFAVAGQDVLPGHLELHQCESQCYGHSACQAIVWHDTKDDNTPNCYLRKNVKVLECQKNQAFNLRMLNPAYVPSAMLRLSTIRSSTQEPTTTPATTKATTEATTKTTTRATTNAPPTPAPPSVRPPWPTVATKFCQDGAGAKRIANDSNPVQEHQLLSHCQERCRQHDACEAIVMRDVQNGHEPNCWLLRDVVLDKCAENDGAAVWFKPGLAAPKADWLSYAATNCYPGRGGDYAIKDQDVLPGHQTLKECERVCNTNDACEAFVWHDTKDNYTSNCYLRKNLYMPECEASQAFNLRRKASFVSGKFSLPANVELRLTESAISHKTLAAYIAAGALGAVAMAMLVIRTVRSDSHAVRRDGSDADCEGKLLEEAG